MIAGDHLSDAVLYVVRAMLGFVTPDLRWVAIGLEDQQLVGRFVYEQPPTEFQREELSDVETLVIADLWPGLQVDFEAVHVPITVEPFLAQGTSRWVYLRYEPDLVKDVVGLSAAAAVRKLGSARDRIAYRDAGTGALLHEVAAWDAKVVATEPASWRVLPVGAVVTLTVDRTASEPPPQAFA